MSASFDQCDGIEPRVTHRSGHHAWIAMALVAFPSFGLIQKFTGLGGVVAYAMVVATVCWLVRISSGRWAPWSRRRFRWLAALVMVGLVACFAVVHPIEDGKGPGKSSDRDEGLNLAVTRMMGGETPYYPPNPEAGPLSLLAGSIILSAPFVALGNSGYQNFFWLAAFLWVALRWFKDGALALALLVVPLALSPAAQYEFISGGDLIANGIFVALLPLFALVTWSDPASPAWKRGMACLLLGLALTSRTNFILLLPLFGAVLWRVAGPRPAIAASTLAGLVILALTVPFYLNDPAGFTPLLARKKLAMVDHALPWASTAMMGASVVAALAGACWLIRKRPSHPATDFLRCCAAVTLVPILCSIGFSSWASGHPDFGFLRDRFGLMVVFFALLGWGDGWLRPMAPRPKTAWRTNQAPG